MTRMVTIGAAQTGPIQRSDTRAEVVERLIALLRQGAEAGCDLVVFPELALTTFFPRWFVGDRAEFDHFFHKHHILTSTTSNNAVWKKIKSCQRETDKKMKNKGCYCSIWHSGLKRKSKSITSE